MACIAMLGITLGAASAAAQRRDPERLLEPAAKPGAKEADTAPASPATRADLETQLQLRGQSPDLLAAPVDPATYVLGPGDVLAAQIVVGETRAEQLLVLPEGVVLVPNVGPVQAAGLTLAVFRDRLQEAIARRYRVLEVHCNLARPRQFRVYVTGAVQQPGGIAARATERVSDLVERAGGFAPGASERAIEVRDAGGRVRVGADLALFRLRGDLGRNPNVDTGDVVFVPVRSRSIEITGAVNAPGTYEPREGDSLRDLVQLAGGLAAGAESAAVSVTRTDASGAVRVETGDLDAASDTGDVTRLHVLSHLAGRRRVFVILPDGEEQALLLGDGETLRDLARRVVDLDPRADWTGAELATHDTSGKPISVPVDLRGALAGGDDRPLQDGDALAVPSVKSYVYVSGYVQRPGRFAYRPDWNINDYIGEAGGPTAGGAIGNVRVFDARGRKRSAGRATRIQRGETVYLDRSFTGKASSALGLVANLSALVISIVALNR